MADIPENESALLLPIRTTLIELIRRAANFGRVSYRCSYADNYWGVSVSKDAIGGDVLSFDGYAQDAYADAIGAQLEDLAFKDLAGLGEVAAAQLLPVIKLDGVRKARP